MAYERFANGGLSSLAVGIDNAVTSLAVASAVGFPTGGNFRIIIDSEIMLVTNVQGQTFTVTRGAEGPRPPAISPPQPSFTRSPPAHWPSGTATSSPPARSPIAMRPGRRGGSTCRPRAC